VVHPPVDDAAACFGAHLGLNGCGYRISPRDR